MYPLENRLPGFVQSCCYSSCYIVFISRCFCLTLWKPCIVRGLAAVVGGRAPF